MRLIVAVVFLLVASPAFSIEPPCEYIKTEVNTTKAPTLYFRWQSCSKEYWCIRTKPEYLSTLPVGSGWENAVEYLTRKAVIAPPLTQDERNLCFAGLTLPTWKVAAHSSYTTRPLFDGDKYEACLANQAITDKTQCNTKPHWVQFGSVAVGTSCEPKVIRSSGGSITYHYTTNAGKVRGLSVCKLQ